MAQLQDNTPTTTQYRFKVTGSICGKRRELDVSLHRKPSEPSLLCTHPDFRDVDSGSLLTVKVYGEKAGEACAASKKLESNMYRKRWDKLGLDMQVFWQNRFFHEQYELLEEASFLLPAKPGKGKRKREEGEPGEVRKVAAADCRISLQLRHGPISYVLVGVHFQAQGSPVEDAVSSDKKQLMDMLERKRRRLLEKKDKLTDLQKDVYASFSSKFIFVK